MGDAPKGNEFLPQREILLELLEIWKVSKPREKLEKSYFLSPPVSMYIPKVG